MVLAFFVQSFLYILPHCSSEMQEDELRSGAHSQSNFPQGIRMFYEWHLLLVPDGRKEQCRVALWGGAALI